VQGVWFRASTRERAEQLGLVGWVRNRADGSVELEAEGAAAAVEAILAWCRGGPPGARVDAVDVEPIAPAGGDGFSIHY
jgi:acylphosphatase